MSCWNVSTSQDELKYEFVKNEYKEFIQKKHDLSNDLEAGKERFCFTVF